MSRHVIETDLEPDDLIQIQQHAKTYKNVHLTIIVGEAEAHNKIELATDFMKCIQMQYPEAYTDVEVFQGFNSPKKFPIRPTFAMEEDPLLTKCENYTRAVQAADVIFMMKPPREAIECKVTCPNATAYAYGSFNWRTLKLSLQECQDLMSRYKKFYYVDSFSAIGEMNSGDYISNGSLVSTFIVDVITQWNIHMIEKCRADLSRGDTDAEGVARLTKIIANIGEKIRTQFVLADVCISLLHAPEPEVHSAVLVSVNPYPKWEPGPSNTYVFNEDHKAERRERIVAAMRE